MTTLIAIALHFIGDFPLQSDLLAQNKGKSWEVLLYHCLIYGALFYLFGATMLQTAILISTHFVIDALKARYNLINQIWQDQLCHIAVILILFEAIK
jgi:biotin transporter BioY